MKWLKKKLYAWVLEEGKREESRKNTDRLIASTSVEEDIVPWNDGLRITVKKMIGGFVVSFRVYDRKTDRSDDRAYIITDEQDFNAELGKMITMESMRQS